MVEIWSWLGLVSGILGLYIAGKRNIGWLIASLSSISWIIYAVLIHSWALFITDILYGVIDFRNYLVNRGNGKKR